ncbi:hypothetical protein PSEUDO8AS_30253 [Pseudomonas sp. 8AS]|nr:hypothetical protein PSEUDO8AS_30253 [Pseudomonas sp. 8AS]
MRSSATKPNDPASVVGLRCAQRQPTHAGPQGCTRLPPALAHKAPQFLWTKLCITSVALAAGQSPQALRSSVCFLTNRYKYLFLFDFFIKVPIAQRPRAGLDALSRPAPGQCTTHQSRAVSSRRPPLDGLRRSAKGRRRRPRQIS